MYGSWWRRNFFNVGVTDKGFISFAAEQSWQEEEVLEAAKVMKPCSELNLCREVDLGWVLFCCESSDSGFRKEVGGWLGAAGQDRRQAKAGW
jgi:hypothetical protein